MFSSFGGIMLKKFNFFKFRSRRGEQNKDDEHKKSAACSTIKNCLTADDE